MGSVRHTQPTDPTPNPSHTQAAALAGAGIGLLWWFQERLVSVCDVCVCVGRGVAPFSVSTLPFFPPPRFTSPKYPASPTRSHSKPDRFGLDYEDVWLTAADGVKLHAWLLRAPAGGGDGVASGNAAPRPRARGPLLIFFQENAGNMAMRLPFLRLLVRNLGCAVLAPR